jgi:hypothetical protein
MVPVTWTEVVPKAPVIGSPYPGCWVTASSTTSSAAWTWPPPVVASLTSSDTTTGTVPSAGLGVTVSRDGTGPTWSSDGGGAAVSRNVIMPPLAMRVGSSSVMPLLLRWPPASKRVSLAPPPAGIRTRVSMVEPGARSATSEESGCSAG